MDTAIPDGARGGGESRHARKQRCAEANGAGARRKTETEVLIDNANAAKRNTEQHTCTLAERKWERREHAEKVKGSGKGGGGGEAEKKEVEKRAAPRLAWYWCEEHETRSEQRQGDVCRLGKVAGTEKRRWR